MARGGALPLELGARQLQRRFLAHLFRIGQRAFHPRALASGFPFIAQFLQPRLCVDESFTSITH